MANIKLLNLETSSSLSEVSTEETDGIIGGAHRLARSVYRATGNRRMAIEHASIKYWQVKRRTGSKRRALAASLSGAE